jgi:hypothetical protein
MKYFQLIGGFAGFVLAFASSLSTGNEIAIALRDGAVGCVVGALLMRGFFAALVWSVRDVATERARIRAESNRTQGGF